MKLPPQKMRGALVSMWVLDEIFLMVLFGVKPIASRDNLCDNFFSFEVQLLNLCGDLSRSLLLLWRVCKDCRAVLCASVRALAVEGRGVVHAVEELDQVGVLDLVRWSIDNL